MLKKVLFVAFLCISLLGISQEQTEPLKQKIGLVLSGGGAKGLAHIGVLKVIDSLGIKIDYIGGTSMGAIVGGLYASGYTGNQLDSIFNAVDFAKVIQDNLPRSAKTFYEKEDTERYAVTVPFENFKVSFPSGLSKGQNVFGLIAQLTKHVSDVNDFRDLPIPFFCIATDVETGQAVKLDKGYLADAISASGAFPSLFEPFELDGQMLIDGGVTNNYPINLVKEMGATVVIGVDVQDDLRNREQLKSAPDILLQINNYRTITDMKLKSLQTDVYIKPDISDFTVISFEEGTEIIRKGKIEALAEINKLKALQAKQDEPYIKEKLPSSAPEVFIKNVVVLGDQKYPRGYVTGKLRINTPDTISFEKLDQGISNLAATGNFKSIRYRFQQTKDIDNLILYLNKSEGSSFLRFGLHYDNLYKSAAMVNFTKKRLFLDNDVASLDLILGDNLRYNFEYYIDKGRYWSIGLRSRYNSFKQNIQADVLTDDMGLMLGLNKIELDVSDFTNQFYIETVIKEEFSFSVGAEHKRLKYDTPNLSDNSDENLVFDNSDYGSVFSQLRFDTYDSKYFPHRGLYFEGDGHLYLFSSDFNDNFSEFAVVKGEIGAAIPVSDQLTVGLGSSMGFKIGISDVQSFDFVLGGYGNNLINNFMPFFGYDFLSFGGDSFIKGNIKLDYEFFDKNHINFEANYANAGISIFNDGEWFTEPNFSGYAIGYGLETFLGPIEIKYAWSPEGKNDNVFFNLGFWF
ncbi:patatin-like phospholipase family protein [Spongiivirga citrea]|uniref:Patatin n=1 Tax=Spongiivirga citrea TaxID=1481457 RepID=A0A6M0CMC0_9FLAO|nr:patatin-like phospholipase family protein [Spongiivirga citrea]NER17154.1 patatin [Spongiivirga citrea]